MDIIKKINDFENYEYEFGGRNLANHLPMALYSLYRLDATQQQVNDFVSFYRKETALKVNTAEAKKIKLNKDNITEYLGTRSYYQDYKSFYKASFKEIGWEETLYQYLPLLVGGLSASAFHAWIRLAYGIESQNEAEMLNGLAF